MNESLMEVHLKVVKTFHSKPQLLATLMLKVKSLAL